MKSLLTTIRSLTGSWLIGLCLAGGLICLTSCAKKEEPAQPEGKRDSGSSASSSLAQSPPPQSAYATAEVLIRDLQGYLERGDLEEFLELSGASPELKQRLREMVSQGYDYVPARSQVSAASGATKELTLVFRSPGNDQSQQVTMTLRKGPNARWEVRRMEMDLPLDETAQPDSKPLPKAGDQALAVANQFLQAVINRDFPNASKTVDSRKLTEEKLAALFIVVEEGGFKAHPERPLISTMAANHRAWVIARLKSPAQESEFGIEMERQLEWKVVGLNFSRLLQIAARQAGAGDVAYSPIRKNISGGDQIVLYFEFDDVEVNVRASKQLTILADFLRADPSKVLTINGHADAKGEEDYNERLSLQRADKVRKALIANGIPERQVQIKAFGEAKPTAPNENPDGSDNPSGRAQNRRAELYLEF